MCTSVAKLDSKSKIGKMVNKITSALTLDHVEMDMPSEGPKESWLTSYTIPRIRPISMTSTV
jgi:hypothetical protein